ncbi:MAG: flagellar export protein FliJ [Ruminiclostridium sp.]|jgi:flagellar FliJ protein|nr:flagellar export protein FliJ [Ruminiclostridium sp.]MCI9467080.1 flagellar export protein FliJ [Ruminiclostridium sp.]
MKKFKFSLDTVLSYKEQVLDALKGEHAAILVKVREQEDYLDGLWSKYRAYNAEYSQRKIEGMTILDATIYQSGLRHMETVIQQETERLETLRKEEEAKRQEVVEAKKETSSLDKLKEKKLDLYNKSVQKAEEILIDEFVSSARSRSGASASA